MKKLILASALIFAASTAVQANEHEGGKCAWKKGNHSWMDKADTNNDGTLTKAEFMASNEEFFKKLDANNDGSVTKEERSAHHDKMKAEHEARKAEFMGKYDTDKDGKLSDAEKEVMKKDKEAKKAE